MSFTVVLSVLAAIAAFAAAIKALPVIWNWLKSLVRFIQGLEHVHAIPTYIEDDADLKAMISEVLEENKKLSRRIVSHVADEEKSRREEKEIVAKISENVEKLSVDLAEYSYKLASVVFKQATFADPDVAYYMIEKQNGHWVWIWGNRKYHELTGLSALQAAAGQFWNSVDPSEKDSVMDSSHRAGDNDLPFDMGYTNVNVETGERTRVRVLAYPITDRSGKAALYLGAIQEDT